MKCSSMEKLRDKKGRFQKQLDLGRAIVGQKHVTGSIFMCQRQSGKTASLKPGKHGTFRFCPYYYTCPSLKSGTPTLTKVTILKLIRQAPSCHKVLVCYLYNCSYDRHLKMGCIFGQIMPQDSQKHFCNKQVLRKHNKRYSVHFTFCESFKSTPNSLPNFKSLKVLFLFLEIIGEWGGGVSTAFP